MFEDDLPTSTSKQQIALEKKVLPFYQEFEGLEPDEISEYLELLRSAHITYLQGGLGQLASGFASLDASRPWICYWILHSLALLDAPLPQDISADEIVDFFATCQLPDGGFGGGPYQLAHLAPTYAAVCALITLGTPRALALINRQTMWAFLQRMCIPPAQGGGFRVHDGGEGDLRACFTAMALAHMLALDKVELARRSGLVEYVRRCQTYEGGLGGEPGNEAHGGYTFCGLSAVTLAGQPCVLNLPRLLHWAAARQGWAEGGFNGRTNKLVDGCYSFWQGGVFPLLQAMVPEYLQHTQAPQGNAAYADAALLHFRVPPLPALQVQSQVDQAEDLMNARVDEFEALRTGALAAGEAADAALHGTAARWSRDSATQARQLLDQCTKAQEAAELASTHLAMVNSGAALMFVLPDPDDPDPPNIRGTGQPLPPPLYNYKALQLWILKCCQYSKGGLRDKPGKPVDYYHTCYCLSGLTSAQHASGCVLGPRENKLKASDPLVNVVEDKLRAAMALYAKQPLQLVVEMEE